MERVWRKISALLMDNGEDNPQPLSVQIGGGEAVGLSTLDCLWTESVFQDPKEGIVMVRVEGCDELLDLSDLSDADIEAVLDGLVEAKGYTPQLVG